MRFMRSFGLLLAVTLINFTSCRRAEYEGVIEYEGVRITFENPDHAKTLNLTELDEIMWSLAFHLDDWMGYPIGDSMEVMRFSNIVAVSEPFPCLRGTANCNGIHKMYNIKFVYNPDDCLARTSLAHEWVHAIQEFWNDRDPNHEMVEVWRGALGSLKAQVTPEYCSYE